MTLVLAFDTETTGLPLFKEPSEHPDQPHICQIAAQLFELENGTIHQEMNHIIKPDGWVIPEDVTKIHGISHEHALEVGLDEMTVVTSLIVMAQQASYRIAHNEPFDQRIIRIALLRAGMVATADWWASQPATCTANLSSPILKLPPTQKMLNAGRRHPKTPNLGEAYEFFMHKPFEGAHNALVDVNGCREVYQAIHKLRPDLTS